MEQQWNDFLSQAGGHPADDRTHWQWANPSQAAAQVATQAVMMPLSHWRAVHIQGADARHFLHGQFSSNVQALKPEHWQFSSYNTPKGRVLAVPRLTVNAQESFTALLPQEVTAHFLKRLRLYVLRAKVSLQESTQVLLGFSGTLAADVLANAGFDLPTTTFTVKHNPNCQIWHMGDTRFVVLTDVTQAIALWQTAQAAGICPVGSQTWEYTEIQAGWPNVFTTTQEAFVPQMLNLDTLGGVAFNKGCYPGQEIVARTHYLGKVKRHLFLARSATMLPALGSDLFVPEHDESAGKIVNAHPHPEGGALILAVLRADWCAQQPPRLLSQTGEALVCLPLPYSVDTP